MDTREIAAVADDQDVSFEELLEFLKHSRGFDFTGYKRASIKRRLTKRLQDLRCPDFGSYRSHLEAHPHEFTALFNTLLINVTCFYRNPDAWKCLEATAIPRILSQKGPDDPIRIWTAACASGEETYTIAIMLAEALGTDSFVQRVKIYATDLDEEAVAQARQGVYSAQQITDVPPSLRARYFKPSLGGYVFRADLRRSIIFGRHDLVHDASISRLDLLICRNTMMYFTANLQSRIASRFHLGLNKGGFLFLGKAEMLQPQSVLFRPVNLKHRIFERAPANLARDRLLLLTKPGRASQEPQER